MRIAPVNYGQQQNFEGILKERRYTTYESSAYETTVTEARYDYYPFADETQQEIQDVEKKHNKYQWTNRPYPAWNDLLDSKVNIRATLPITKAQYEALKKETKADDDFIIRTFA